MDGIKREPEYLGDGVYASWDGCQVKLATQRYHGEWHYIYLEPTVWLALKNYVSNVLGEPKVEEPK